MTIQDIHQAWRELDVSTDRDEIRTRWPALADAVGKLKRITAIQYDAAAERIREESDEHNEVTALVVGKHASDRGRRVEQYVKLGEDYVVLVADGKLTARVDRPMWTFTVRGKPVNFFHATQEQAILHLLASRYDPNPNTNHLAAFYAGRMLGIAEPEE